MYSKKHIILPPMKLGGIGSADAELRLSGVDNPTAPGNRGCCDRVVLWLGSMPASS
jgi:hypothetical protein